MQILKLIFFLAIAGFVAHWWKGHQASASMKEVSSDTGFVKTVMVDGATRNVVLILAPPNCPSEQAQRAARLSERLSKMGIPYVLGSSFTISGNDASEEARAGVDRAVAVFEQGAPAVFINDMAKSNPSAEEVAAEYHRARANN